MFPLLVERLYELLSVKRRNSCRSFSRPEIYDWVYRKSVIRTLCNYTSANVVLGGQETSWRGVKKMACYDWTEEESEYFLQSIQEEIYGYRSWWQWTAGLSLNVL